MAARTLEERFTAKFVEDLHTGCWIWIACTNKAGYGRFRVNGKSTNAHRVSYQMAHGPIPAGLYVDHLCRNRACVNPAHLEAVTNAENTLRGDGPTAANLRKTHCARGHEFSAGNTGFKRGGDGRYCRACIRENSAENRVRDPEAHRAYMLAYKRAWRARRRAA